MELLTKLFASFSINDFFTNGLIGKYFLTNQAQTLAIVLMAVALFVVAVCSYLLGSINFAIIISGRAYKQDIRDFGSKNAGMTNMMRIYGKKAAGLTLLGDALKAAVSCLLGYFLVGQFGAYVAGLLCILGHVFPVFYHFRGGKGVVTAAVTVLMCDPFIFLILFTLFVIIVLTTKFISLGSIMCMLLYPLILNSIASFSMGIPAYPFIIFPMLMTVVIVCKHWTNIKRLLNGTESKFSFKKSVKAEETPATTEETNASAKDEQ